MKKFFKVGLGIVTASMLGALTLTPGRCLAQNAGGPDHEYETWFGLFANGPIAGRLHFQGDLHYRAYEDFSPHWVLVRPAIAWLLRPGMFATVGYAWTPSWGAPDGERYTDEHRVWEQWQWEFPIAEGALRVQVRSRLEQRWRENNGSDTGLRFRQMLRVAVPFGGDGRWLVAAWDEIFFGFNTTDWGQRAGFDQNRAFVGVGRWLALGSLRVEVGYFNQYIARYNAQDAVNHALMVNTYVSWR